MRTLFLILVLLLVFQLTSSEAQVVGDKVYHEYLIKTVVTGDKSNKNGKDIRDFFKAPTKKSISANDERVLLKEIGHGLIHVKLGDRAYKEMIETYKGSFSYVEPNYLYYAIPVDAEDESTIPSAQWGLNNSFGTHVDALKAWEISKGSSKVIVGVIDTGVSWNHPALEGNIWTNPKERDNDGVDNDGNGFIDDIHGWNFANGNSDTATGHPHGTHCSGIIAAHSDLAMGIAPKVMIMPIKFLDENGSGSLESAIQSIDYGVRMGAHILSNSWGGGDYSRALEEAIQRAEKAGVLFVAAAGNEYNDNDRYPMYPSSYKVPNVISVAASTINGDKAYFSNYGARTVDIFAPGMDIYSTVHDGGYASMSGTSMACPMVSGIAALVKSVYPNQSYSFIKERILKSAKRLPAMSGLVNTNGLVNAYKAIKK